MVQTSDLSPDDFAILANKVVSRTGLAGPYQLLSGTIDDYENQSGKPELVWLGGTEEDPFCIWVSYPGGAYLKLKWPTPSETGFCQSVLDCIVADLERGGGTRERYLIPELTGPDWQIVEVLYGDGDDAQFGLIEGESLIDLMVELNGAETLPEDWLFSIDGGVLVLSVPHGTNVTSIELGSGAVVEFDGPSFDGAPGSTLTDPLTVALAGPLELIIQQYEELLTTYTGLLGESVEFSVATTEAGVESAYSAYLKATVRWTDADGDPRISYKTPTNVWYHPADKAITPTAIYSYTPSNASSVASSTVTGTVTPVTAGIPSNAKNIRMKVVVAMANISASSGTTYVANGTITGLRGVEAEFHMARTHAELVTLERLLVESFTGRRKANGNFDISFNVQKTANHFLNVIVYATGWSR